MREPTEEEINKLEKELCANPNLKINCHEAQESSHLSSHGVAYLILSERFEKAEEISELEDEIIELETEIYLLEEEIENK